ncbi:SDR family NAD(P)-dependent oxidoreductase [Chloroflexota bacterium]
MILDRFSLNGKVAIVTGSGRGIGKAIALAFAEAGADITCTARTQNQIEITAEGVRTLGRKALAVPCDVGDSNQVTSMVEKTVAEFGHIDILVNNAGGGSFGGIRTMPRSTFEADIQQNLTSIFMCSQAVSQYMLDQKSGCIINISTRESQVPAMGLSAYAASKAGVNSLTSTLAWELGPYVRVNAILPGAVVTETNAPIFEPIKDQLSELSPLNRLGTPEDIALAALYLASPASDWVTGRLFSIDGGAEWSYQVMGAMVKDLL